MSQNIKLLVKSACFSFRFLYLQNKKPSTQKGERHIFCRGLCLRCFCFSAIVQGGDHIDCFIHRAALVADDYATACQHPAAEVVCLAVRCNEEIATAIHCHTGFRIHYHALTAFTDFVCFVLLPFNPPYFAKTRHRASRIVSACP